MALKLRIISDHYKSLGSRRSQLFGVTGGTIGRATDNDWVLPDTNRFLSSRHARVMFSAGNWLIEDTSRNGVFLNHDDAPLAQSGPAKLEDGDRLRLGEYEILVSIDEHSDFSPDASGQMPVPAQLRDAASGDAKRSRRTAKRHGTFRSEPAPSEVKLDAYLQPDLEVTDLLVPANRAADKKDTLATSASIKLNVDGFPGASEALADFSRGLGVEPSSLPSRAQSTLLAAAGHLLRETVNQLAGTLKWQTERLADLDAASNSARQDLDNPFLSTASLASMIYRLLDAQSERRLNGVDALRDAFMRIREHEAAYDAAIAAAVDELLARVNPAKIAARCEQSSAASVFGGGKKSKYWDSFGETFAVIDQRDARGWPTVFTREFAKAMAARLRDQRRRN